MAEFPNSIVASAAPSAAMMRPDSRNRGPAWAQALAPALLLCVAGCKIVDQTTFGSTPEKPQADMLTRALQPGPPIPLVDIVFNGGQVAYNDQLRLAVLMAEGRRPGIQYDLVTVVPARGSPADQVAAARDGESDAIAVAGRMNALGVDPPRIHMSARTDPGASSRELRIYVR